MAVLILMRYLIEISGQHYAFLWLFSGNILYYLINIEDNGNDIFMMIRNIILILMLYGLFIIIGQTKKFMRPKNT
jgi:hypothetical protein